MASTRGLKQRIRDGDVIVCLRVDLDYERDRSTVASIRSSPTRLRRVAPTFTVNRGFALGILSRGKLKLEFIRKAPEDKESETRIFYHGQGMRI